MAAITWNQGSLNRVSNLFKPQDDYTSPSPRTLIRVTSLVTGVAAAVFMYSALVAATTITSLVAAVTIVSTTTIIGAVFLTVCVASGRFGFASHCLNIREKIDEVNKLSDTQLKEKYREVTGTEFEEVFSTNEIREALKNKTNASSPERGLVFRLSSALFYKERMERYQIQLNELTDNRPTTEAQKKVLKGRMLKSKAQYSLEIAILANPTTQADYEDPKVEVHPTLLYPEITHTLSNFTERPILESDPALVRTTDQNTNFGPHSISVRLLEDAEPHVIANQVGQWL